MPFFVPAIQDVVDTGGRIEALTYTKAKNVALHFLLNKLRLFNRNNETILKGVYRAPFFVSAIQGLREYSGVAALAVIGNG